MGRMYRTARAFLASLGMLVVARVVMVAVREWRSMDQAATAPTTFGRVDDLLQATKPPDLADRIRDEQLIWPRYETSPLPPDRPPGAWW